MSANNDIGLSLCEAFKIIADDAVKGLKFDSTVKCTIVDDSQASEGKYIVSNGSLKFVAYSTEKYLKNTQVYVTIPEGDWDGTKIISGKVVLNADEPFVYSSPFDSYVNVTGNLVTFEKTYGLLTNDAVRETDMIEVKTYQGTPYVGHTCLGVSADFSAWLFEQECVKGNYGLRIELYYTKDEHQITSSTDPYLFKSEIFLDVKDMVGNPYHFESFYRQEKVFRLDEDIKQIYGVRACFFQNQDFYDRYGNPIPSGMGISSDLPQADRDLLDGTFLPNLFMKNLHISLGYGVDEVGDEFAQISTQNSLTYSAVVKAPETNEKTLKLRWLRRNDRDELYTVENSTTPTNMYEVRWYQYDIAADTDGYGGVCWKMLEPTSLENIHLSQTFTPNTTMAREQIKAVAIYGNIEYLPAGPITKEEFKANPKYYYLKDETGKFVQCEKGSSFVSGASYYTASGTKVAKTSNIITFNNEKEVASETTMKALSALDIICYDEVPDMGQWVESHGNYFYYGDNGYLTDDTQASVRRKVTYIFTPIDGTVFDSSKVTDVAWNVPTKKDDEPVTTMIKNFTESADGQEGYYYIGSYFSNNYTDNTITLTVKYENIEYTAVKTLTFGQSSFMGITYNMDLDFDDSFNAILVDKNKSMSYTARVRIYDSSGTEIDVNASEDLTIDAEWVCYKTGVMSSNIIKTGKNKFTFSTVAGKTISKTDIPIVKITVNGLSNATANKSYSIYKYFPIALRSSSSLHYLKGPKEVVYAFDGTVSKSPRNLYRLYGNQDGGIKELSGVTWDIISLHDSDAVPVMPMSIKGDVLQPCPLWEETTRKSYYAARGMVAIGGVTHTWIQPIPIYKSAYFSSIIDNWKEGEIETVDGTILAPRIGAGTKDSKNRFSGVILGDWDGKITKDSAKVKRTGLYGFSAGDATFGFNEDGTAFIGKSGAGRILFDGSNSTIQSANYEATKGGMKIDLDDGKIDAYNFTLSARNTSDSTKYIKISTSETDNPLQLGSNFLVDWTGKLNAQSGRIGNWYISTGDEKRLQSSTGGVYLDPSGTIYGSAIKTGNSDTAPRFHVNSSGSLGIGRKNGASGDTISSTNYNFVVNSNGKVEITGEGSISFVDEALEKESEERKAAIEQEIKDREAAVEAANKALAEAKEALEQADKTLAESDAKLKEYADAIQAAANANAGHIQALAEGEFVGIDDNTSTFINRNKVSSPRIEGGLITGAAIAVTGVNVDVDGDGVKDYISEIQFLDSSKSKHGSLKYESVSTVTESKTPDRVFLTSTNAGLKLQATGTSNYRNDSGQIVSGYSNISIEAAGTIYMMSEVSVSGSDLTIHSGGSLVMTGTGGVDLGCSGYLVLGSSMYGTSDPKTLPGKKGRIYFQIKSS